MPRRFRKFARVRLSEEGRTKAVAMPNMKGVVLAQAGPLVTVKEDGYGKEYDYHKDYLETIPTPQRVPIQRTRTTAR